MTETLSQKHSDKKRNLLIIIFSLSLVLILFIYIMYLILIQNNIYTNNQLSTKTVTEEDSQLINTPTPSETFVDITATATENTAPTLEPTITATPTIKPTAIPTIKSTPTPSTFSPRVLFIGYNPIENGVSAADKYFSGSMSGLTAQQYETKIANDLVSSFKRLSNNTINYSVVKTIHDSDFPTYTDGTKLNINTYSKCVFGTPIFDSAYCDQLKTKFSYNNWLTKNAVCKIAKDNNIDEIWMLSLPFIMMWENFMIGQNYGFDVNGASYTDVNCSKHYIVVNGTYERGDMMLHNYGHRIEATMRTFTNKWNSADRKKYWEDFTTTQQYSGITVNTTRCGNAHYPGNTNSAYDVSNQTFANINCKGMSSFPNVNVNNYENINCSKWGCSDSGWQEYWFSYLPNSIGTATINSSSGGQKQILKNWWNYIIYPDKILTF